MLLSLHRFGKQVKQLTSDKQNGSVVQLVRMPPCHGGGRGFESRPDRKVKRSFRLNSEAFFIFDTIYALREGFS